jgi:hypothetical protein
LAPTAQSPLSKEAEALGQASAYEGAIVPPEIKPQYKIFRANVDTLVLKCQKGLNGNRYILAIHVPPLQSSPAPSYGDDKPSAIPYFDDLPYIPSSSTIQSYLAMNNKEDTLTQSQMLKAPDSTAFIQAQIPELHGLEAMGVFNTAQQIPCLLWRTKFNVELLLYAASQWQFC